MSHRKQRNGKNGQHWPLQPILPISLFPVRHPVQSPSSCAYTITLKRERRSQTGNNIQGPPRSRLSSVKTSNVFLIGTVFWHPLSLQSPDAAVPEFLPHQFIMCARLPPMPMKQFAKRSFADTARCNNLLWCQNLQYAVC